MSKRKIRAEERKARTVRYDLDPTLKQTIADLAAQHQVPRSQVASVLLLRGLESLNSGEIDLEAYLTPSRTPVFNFFLDLEKFKNRDQS